MPKPDTTSERTSTRVIGQLRRRLLGWMLLVSLIPLLVMAAEGYLYGTRAVVEKTNEHLLSVLTSRQALVDGWIRQRLTEIDILAASPSIARCCQHFRSLTESEIETETTMLLDAVTRGIEAYDYLGVYDANWSAIASSGAANTIEAAGIPLDVKNGIENSDGFVLGMPALNEDGHVMLHVGLPVRRTGGRVGALYARINITTGLAPLLLDRSGLGNTGKTYLVAQDLRLLTEPIEKSNIGVLAAAARADFFALDLETPAVRHYSDFWGRPVIYAAARVPRVDWVLVAEMDETEANEWLRVLAWRAGATAIVTIIALILVATWISDRLGKPLAELARVALRIRGGFIEERLPPMPTAEADEVRIAFNQMLDELKAKQQELVRTATLAYVGELTASIVHEMRNPLSSVKMNIQALKRRIGNDPAFAELAQIAEAQARRLEIMLDDLLQYGRPVELRHDSTPFSVLTRRAIEAVSEQSSARNVAIALDDHTGGNSIAGDSEHLCRALTNLLSNAIQASPEGSTVTVAGQAVNGPAPAIRITVADQGPGLSSEVSQHLFNPFYTTKPNGTGLGLANVKKIVELHGGTVSAENATSGGARFTMTIPAQGRIN